MAMPAWLVDATVGKTAAYPHTITDDGMLLIDCKIEVQP
jgi:hypothetical protein